MGLEKERERYVYLAKLSEQAERYDGQSVYCLDNSLYFRVFIVFLFMRRRDFLWGLFPGLLHSGILGVSLCARAVF